MDIFKYLVYKATPQIGGGILIAGFVEREDALDYMDYIKSQDNEEYYIKEYSQQINT